MDGHPRHLERFEKIDTNMVASIQNTEYCRVDLGRDFMYPFGDENECRGHGVKVVAIVIIAFFKCTQKYSILTLTSSYLSSYHILQPSRGKRIDVLHESILNSKLKFVYLFRRR